MPTSGHLFLYGPPASGKTTLARRLAASLDRPCLDTDELITAAHGPIPGIFAREGETAFRQHEAQVLHSLLAEAAAPQVISLGGGTLLNPALRQLCASQGSIICLDAPPEAELQRRLGLAPGSRPLGNRAQERAGHYASFPSRLTVSFSLPDSLVLVGSTLAPLLLPAGRTVFDATVATLFPQLAAGALGQLPSGEKFKTPDTVLRLWRLFAGAGLGRRDFAASCGGGVTSDLVGFAAATWMRGIPWLNFPTTLLAMVDASTGGKTGCDLPEGKNLAGAFHSPRLVVIDTDFLATLPPRELRSGRAEMLKHDLIGNLHTAASPHLPTAREIADNLAVKIAIVQEDPLETTGRRLLLNCGHTVAHALETASNYQFSHGEAVAIGCVEEAKLAVRLGLAPAAWPQQLEETFRHADLPTQLPPDLSFDALKPLMRGDKKRQGDKVVFALPCAWGDVRPVKVPLA